MPTLTHFKKRRSVPLSRGQAEGLGVVTPTKMETTPTTPSSPLNRGTSSELNSTPFKGSERSSGGCPEVSPETIAPFQRTHYNKKLLNRSKTMSRAMTKAENRIWFDLLSKKQLLGLKFIKQKIVFSYILDFYCSELSLAIEIDGESHDTKLDYDKNRDNFIKACGIKVIRLTNQDVLENLEGVREYLINNIQKMF